MAVEQPPQIDLNCPACGETLPARIHLLVDAGRQPRLGEQARSGQLNQLTCPHCRAVFFANVPFLYHDPVAGLAVAHIPAAADEPDELVTALLGRLVDKYGNDDLPAYLLEPQVVRGAVEFQIAATGGSAQTNPPVDHPDLAATMEWLILTDDQPVIELAEALSLVGSEADLLEVLNTQPDLLDPERLLQVIAAADHAEAEDLPAVAEFLRSIAAMLHLHIPTDDDDPVDPEVGDATTFGVRRAIVLADLEAAAEYLEPPNPARQEEIRRVMEGLHEVEEQREGFLDHAMLFGGLLEAMLEPATPDEFRAEAAGPSVLPDDDGDLPADLVMALLSAPTTDEAIDLLHQHPELVSDEGLRAVRKAATQAADDENEALLSQLEMVIDTISIALDEQDDDPPTEGDAL